MPSNIKFCGQCALRTQDGVHCGVTGLEINPDVDFCSKFADHPTKCEICGRFIVGHSYLEEIDGVWRQYCGSCLKKLGTCALCERATICDFEQNPSPIPKTIQKQIQRGPMTAVTNIPNPERIRETCEKNCECYDAENDCLKQNIQMCAKFKYTFQEDK